MAEEEKYHYGEVVYYKYSPGLYRFQIYERRPMKTGGKPTDYALCAGPDGTVITIHPSLLKRDPWPS